MAGDTLHRLGADRKVVQARGIEQNLQSRKIATGLIERAQAHLELLERVGIFSVGLFDFILQRADAVVQLVDTRAGEVDALLIILDLLDKRRLIRFGVHRFGAQRVEPRVQLRRLGFVLLLLRLDLTDLRVVFACRRRKNIRGNQQCQSQYTGNNAHVPFLHMQNSITAPRKAAGFFVLQYNILQTSNFFKPFLK